MIATLIFLAAQGPVLGLADAVRTAEAHQPQLRQAHANTDVALARADEARAPILPQVTGVASYQRSTSNFTPRPGFPVPATTPAPSFDTYNYFNFGLTLNQFIWDFGQTTDRWRAAKASAEAQGATERATHLQVILGVRTAFFTARAQKALVGVARETLENQDRHRKQIEGFVEAGTRPEIDRLQAETDYSNAEVSLITAENGYETAKVALNQAMGVVGPTDYDVADQSLPAVDGEAAPIDVLVDEAAKTRPELASLERQLRAQELTLSAVKGGYGPAIGASMSLTDAGTDLGQLGWNWSAAATVTWPLFQGLLTHSQVHEQHAALIGLTAVRDGFEQQVRVEVDQARLQVRAAKATIAAADRAATNARARLGLAENRYQEGVGSVIELGDAQVALTLAAAQKVQADFSLATARAQLLKALGRI